MRLFGKLNIWHYCVERCLSADEPGLGLEDGRGGYGVGAQVGVGHLNKGVGHQTVVQERVRLAIILTG